MTGAPAPRRGTRPSLAALLAWYAVALALVDLVFFSGASNFLPSPQARILTQLIVGGSTLAWVITAWRTAGPDPVASPLLLPGLAWAAVQLLAAATSQRPASSLEAIALVLLALPGYLVIRAVLRDPVLRPRVDWLLVVATLVFLVAYLWQVVDQWLAWWDAVGLSLPPLRPAYAGLTVGTPNAVAVYVELLAAPAAWIAWRRWHRRALPLLLLVLGAASLGVSASRGGWMGAAAGVMLVVSLRAWGNRPAGSAETGRPWTARVLPGGGRGAAGTAARAAVGLAVVVLLLAVGPLLAARLLAGDAGRGELWNAGLQVWSQHPVLGGGPGTWPGLRAGTEILDPFNAVLYTPHSSLVQVLAETGLVGLAASLGLVAAIGRLAWRSIRDATSVADRTERLVVAGALLAVLVHSLVDPMFHIPAVALLILLLVARLEAGVDAHAAPVASPVSVSPNPGQVRASRLTAGRRRLLPAVVPVLAGAALLVPIDAAMLDGQRGVDALDAGRAAEAGAAFDRAVAAHDLAPYRVGQAVARASLGDTAGAITALQAAHAAEPLTFIAAQVAWATARTDPAAGAALARETIRAGLYDPAATVNLAIVLDRDGDRARAVTLLADAFHQLAVLIHSNGPNEIPADLWAAAQAAALDRIRLESPGLAALEELLAGFRDRAAADLQALPAGPQRRLLEQVAAAEAGATPDLVAARADLRTGSSDPLVLATFDRLARVARSEPDIRRVRAMGIAAFAALPTVDFEIRLDGAPDDRFVLVLERWPMASDSRLGPLRPFLPGMATIQPVRR